MKYIISLAVILIISTFLIVIPAPEMHKPIQIVSIDVKIKGNTAIVESKTTVLTTPEVKAEQPAPGVSPLQTTVKKQTVEKKEPIKTKKEISFDTFTNYPKATDDVKTTNTEVKAQPVKRQIQTTAKTTVSQKPVQKVIYTPEKTTNTSAKTVSQKTTGQKTPTQPKVQTPVKQTQEEIIAWNQWNANVRNQILGDLAAKRNNKSLVLPSATYKFSFRVSKNRTITNVSVTANNDNPLTQNAISAINVMINEYSGSDFLAFPKGSQKTYYDVSFNTVTSGSVKRDTKASASDFHEYEKIQK